MEAWYNEQKANQDRLLACSAQQEARLSLAHTALEKIREDIQNDGRTFIEEAGRRFDVSTQRLEENVKGLGLHQERVELLAGELKNTVKELDQARDEMMRLHQDLEHKGSQLEQTRDRLSARETELSHQQAKLAALTLILEDNSWDQKETGTEVIHAQTVSTAPTSQQDSEATILDLAANTDLTHSTPSTPCNPPRATPTYQFLAPDHEES
jgi:chromosome segregation ATPase